MCLLSSDYDLTRSIPLSLNLHLHGNAILHRLYMADHADHAALRLEGLKGVNCKVQTFNIKGAETLVDEQST